MILQLFNILRTCSLVFAAEVGIGDGLEAAVGLGWRERIAALSVSFHRVERLHLSQVILVHLVIALSPSRLLLVRLHVVDEVFVAASTGIIIISQAVIALVHAELDGGVDKLALELRLLRIENHLFTVLVRLELSRHLALVIGGVGGELHADAGGHEDFLVLFAGQQRFFIRQLT